MIGSVVVTALSIVVAQHDGHDSSISKAVGEMLQRTDIRFFGDVAGRYLQDKLGQPPTTFAIGTFDMYVLGHISEEFSALVETAFEYDEDQKLNVDIERMHVNWAPRSWFQVTVGRYHSPLGFWTTAFHHGKWMYTSVEAPLMSKFEDQAGPLPVHTIGILLSGKLDLGGSVALQYDLGAGNGRGPTPDPVLNSRDVSGRKAALAGIHLYVGGLRFGVAGYLDNGMVRANRATTGPADVSMKEQIGVADITYTRAPWELLLEGAMIRHTFDNGPEVLNYTSYAQIAYTIADRWRPYVRGEIQQISDRELFLFLSPREKRLFGGLRFDPIPALGIKVEGAWLERQERPGFLAQAQIAFVL